MSKKPRVEFVPEDGEDAVTIPAVEFEPEDDEDTYVEPSSPKDKHCLMGHTLPLDTDVSDQCRGGCGDYYPDDRGDCTNLRQALQPEPMPLKVGDVIQPRSFVFPEKALAKHDQQVRKDFAEECIKILSEETSKIRVRIRAMAEKE